MFEAADQLSQHLLLCAARTTKCWVNILPWLCFHSLPLLEKAAGEAGSHTLEEFAINLLNNAFERIAVQCQHVLPVVAKVNSIYPPSCLSPSASVWMQTRKKVTATLFLWKMVPDFCSWLLTGFLTALNPNQQDGAWMSSLILWLLEGYVILRLNMIDSTSILIMFSTVQVPLFIRTETNQEFIKDTKYWRWLALYTLGQDPTD